MLKAKFIVLALIIALAAVIIAGCTMASCESQNPERRKIAQTVGKAVLKLVVVAYKSGGNKLAEDKIGDMVSDGKISESQASALKSVLSDGISTLENLAEKSDSQETAADNSPAAAPETAVQDTAAEAKE